MPAIMAGMANQTFFGVTRFSLFLPGSTAWKVTRNDERQDAEALHEYLYSEERMLPRLTIFRDYALPIYAGYAEKHEYRHIVQYSEEMPEQWKSALVDLAGKYDFLVLNNQREHAMSARPIMEKLLQDEGAESTMAAWFRVDDDDLLSADYLDQLAAYTTRPYRGMGVSFGYGHLGLYEDGTFTDLREYHKTMLAQGQAFIGSYDAETGKLWFPKSGNHRTSDRMTPFIVDSRTPAFLWTHHAGQDTRADSAEASTDAARDHLRKHKAVTRSEVRKNFPTI